MLWHNAFKFIPHGRVWYLNTKNVYCLTVIQRSLCSPHHNWNVKLVSYHFVKPRIMLQKSNVDHILSWCTPLMWSLHMVLTYKYIDELNLTFTPWDVALMKWFVNRLLHRDFMNPFRKQIHVALSWKITVGPGMGITEPIPPFRYFRIFQHC